MAPTDSQSHLCDTSRMWFALALGKNQAAFCNTPEKSAGTLPLLLAPSRTNNVFKTNYICSTLAGAYSQLSCTTLSQKEKMLQTILGQNI